MKKELCGLDFETGINDLNDCELLYCALSYKDREIVYNLKNENDFIEFLVEITTTGARYVVFNASFDVEIIISLLLQCGFVFDNSEKDKTMKLLAGSKIYKLTIYKRSGNRLVETEFVDLGNIIVGSNLREIAENYTDFHKGDYQAAKENAKDFKEYNLLDARITRVAYENICKELGDNYVTIGSAAFDIMLKTSYKGTRKERRKQFYENYGELSITDDRRMRKFYRGGFGWCSIDYRWEGSINSYDKKSAYPYECICGKPFPTFREHKIVEGYAQPNEEYPFAFIRMCVTGQVKENHCPVLPTRNLFGDSNKYIYDDEMVYIIDIYDEKSEYDFFMENMEIENIDYIDTILMKAAPENPLAAYISKYYKIKEENDGVRRDVAKRLINALTGKLGSNSIQHNITYTLVDGVIKRDLCEEEESDTFATQVVSVITSRTRCSLYEIDAKLRDNCEFRLYCTDSVKHSNNVKLIKEGHGNIGEWKLEKENIEFIYLGLKAYMYDPYNKLGKKEVICAGISKEDKQKIAPEDFYSGNEVDTLVSVRKRNGRIIYEGKKKISTSFRKPRRRGDCE